MTLQKLLSDMRRAVSELNLIENGDRIAVGVSGGKDSLALLSALAAYRRFSPERYELCAITVDLGLGADYTPVADLCQTLDVPYLCERTDIGDIIFNVRKEKNPCSLCSKMRRGALATVMQREGYQKLALGHHADDLAETFLLSLFYEGRLSTFAPKAFMSRSGVTVIRPLVYTHEADIAAYVRDAHLPVVHNPCPANHQTQREYVKNLIASVRKDIPIARERMIAAITHPERNNLWEVPAQKNTDNS
ncbi:MAG: tRNA 2-thiocytidine(32) synthetase TtcA [Clostridia bacterium]|nr:tRNA 2-thiocytidine(32) synthetase TtcA [Clostridia bacterium]